MIVSTKEADARPRASLPPESASGRAARPPRRPRVRRLRPIDRLLLLLLPLLLAAARPPAAPAGELGLELYGDVLYAHHDFGPDQRSDPTGAPPDSRAIVDIPYVVAELEYAFRDDLHLEIELEYEHGGTGSALELEYEEFGEYEIEVEKGGEVVIEQVHLTLSWSEALRLRAGRIVTAFGLINLSHRPTDFMTTVRPAAEVNLLPTTWSEIGLELSGRRGRFAYRGQLVNGLDSSGFGSEHFVAGGAQSRFESVRATDLALVGRLDVDVADGATVGSSIYHGNTTGNRPKPDMKGINAHLTLVDGHALIDRGPFRARAVYLRGHLENADLVSAKNSRLSTHLQVSRTPVAKAAYGWSVELGYDVAPLIDRLLGRRPGPQRPASCGAGVRDTGGRDGRGAGDAWRLYPFVHVSAHDSMAELPDGVFDVPRFERHILAVGANYFPHPDVVIKADWSHRTFGDRLLNDENTFSLDLGFVARILDHD
ncbi:MAG: hypothetical protein PVF43_10140 [Candidatus Eiseniibacteriota bacterium]